MNAYCAAPGCQNYENMNSSITFYAFPTEEKNRANWLSFIGRSVSAVRNWRSLRLCSEHFTEFDFYEVEQLDNDGAVVKRYLRDGATPTILNNPQSLLHTILNEDVEDENETKPKRKRRKGKSSKDIEEKENFNCEICDSTFKTKSALIVHQKFHDGDRTHACTFCTSKFRTKSLLTLHIRTHTGEKPYNCKYCGKAYGAKSNLYVHERIHTGAKPYKCPYCTKRFNQKTAMVIHSKTHSQEEMDIVNSALNIPVEYKCSVCKRVFQSAANLGSHSRVHKD